jgi:hypothetical protein
MDIWLEIPSPVPAVLPRRVVVPFDRSLSIGRAESLGVDINTTSRSASNRHCEVGRDGCGAWVRDNRSRSGTYLNDRQIEGRCRVLPGDVVRVPDFQMRVGWDFEVHPEWLRWEGGLIVSLVREVWDEKDCTVSLILADALEDAGCGEAGILRHLRGPGLHADGCWALDALLRRDTDGYRRPHIPD